MKEIGTADMAAPDKNLSRKALFPFVHVEKNWDKMRDPPPERQAPEIGETRVFVPACMVMPSGYQYQLVQLRDYTVRGEIVQVNERGRWYRVRYAMPDGSDAFECFKY